jgi:hypothetical protein
MKILGALLIVVGLIGIVWGGFTYTKREKIVDIGPIEATRDKHERVPIPPIAGAASLIVGITLLAMKRG